MKKVKKLITVMLAAFVLTTAVAVPMTMTAEAAVSRVTVPSAIRIGVGARNSSYIMAELPSASYTVKNIKVYKGSRRSSMVKYKLTTSSSYTNRNYSYNSYYRKNIFLYAKKAGTYTMKFDIYKGKKKISNRSVKIYALSNGDGAFQKVLVNGKNVYNDKLGRSAYLSANKVRVKFVPSKGIKIKSITVSYTDQNGNEKTKNFKNGSQISLCKVGASTYTKEGGASYYYSSSYSYKGYWAATSFTITYIDKYASDSTSEQNTSFWIYRKATRWP